MIAAINLDDDAGRRMSIVLVSKLDESVCSPERVARLHDGRLLGLRLIGSDAVSLECRMHDGTDAVILIYGLEEVVAHQRHRPDLRQLVARPGNRTVLAARQNGVQVPVTNVPMTVTATFFLTSTGTILLITFRRLFGSG